MPGVVPGVMKRVCCSGVCFARIVPLSIKGGNNFGGGTVRDDGLKYCPVDFTMSRALSIKLRRGGDSKAKHFQVSSVYAF